MKLLMYGVNKETVMKEDTIKYFLDDKKRQQQMNDIATFEGVEEIVILTNDFRNEYYLFVDELIFSHGEFLRYLAEQTDKSLQEIILETYSKFNEDVLSHVFEVSSGYLTNPKGSVKVLKSIEEALQLAEVSETSGVVTNQMFQHAIQLTFDLKLNDTTKPLNQTRLSKYIYALKEQMGGLDKKNYLISGTDLDVYFLTKILLFAGAQSISIIQQDENEAQRQQDMLKKMLTELESTKVHPITSKSLYFRLSKTDAAILDTSKINLFHEEIREEVKIIRQTNKVQYLIDTGDHEPIDVSYPKLDIRLINGSVEQSFNEEELTNANVEFEEKLAIEIKQFMSFLNDLQVNNMEEQLLN